MQYIVSGEEMKRCDQVTIQEFHMPSAVLMERAALCTVAEIKKRRSLPGRVLIVAGTGNNGGDGLAVGRTLAQQGYAVDFVLVGEIDRCSKETKHQIKILGKYGFPIQGKIEKKEYDIIVDAVFGIGLTRKVQGQQREAILTIERLRQMSLRPVLVCSVDLPSGINADTGAVMGCGVRADLTVTFAFSKRGHWLYPGASYTGELVISDIGITAAGFLQQAPELFTFEEPIGQLLPERDRGGHKGTFGKVLLVAGQMNMSGAAELSGRGCFGAGTGMVKIMTHQINREILQINLPEAMIIVYDTEEEPESISGKVRAGMKWADSIVIGPGIGTESVSQLLLQTVLTEFSGPAVLDADALNLLAEAPELQKLVQNAGNIILTPHMGEFARLYGCSTGEAADASFKKQKELAERLQCTVVCKDARTFVCQAGREAGYLNTRGNDGMATAGSGDVLAGIIGGLLAQGAGPFAGACTGVYLHSLAGDLAARNKSRYAMMASDIADALSAVILDSQTGMTDDNKLTEFTVPTGFCSSDSPFAWPMVQNYQRAFAQVSLDAIRNNIINMKKNIDPLTRMIAVIKADGYGHGAIPIGKELEPLDFIYGFATATPEEALILRHSGIKKPLLVLGYTFPYAYEQLLEKDIMITVFREDAVLQLAECAEVLSRQLGKRIIARVHVKIDTGMSRLGIRPDESGIVFLENLLKQEGLQLEGIFSHFARADELDKTSAKGQLEQFRCFVDRIEKELQIKVPLVHCSNSAGILEMREANLDAVRVGITMYGLWPSEEVDKNRVPLVPALSLFSRIVFLKKVSEGVPISYGGTYVTGRKSVIATIPLGYGDGYPRSLSNQGFVLIRGQRAPIIGRVCMDQLMVDVTDIPEVREGDQVTLIGQDGEERITAELIGDISGRFNYELVCGLGKRIPRVYTKGGAVVSRKDYYQDF